MELEKDTQEQVAKGEKLIRLCDSLDWQEAKSMLTSKMDALDRLSSIELNGDVQDLANDIKARISAKQIIEGWIAEVEGTAEQHKQFGKSLAGDNEHIMEVD